MWKKRRICFKVYVYFSCIHQSRQFVIFCCPAKHLCHAERQSPFFCIFVLHFYFFIFVCMYRSCTPVTGACSYIEKSLKIPVIKPLPVRRVKHVTCGRGQVKGGSKHSRFVILPDTKVIAFYILVQGRQATNDCSPPLITTVILQIQPIPYCICLDAQSALRNRVFRRLKEVNFSLDRSTGTRYISMPFTYLTIANQHKIT